VRHHPHLETVRVVGFSPGSRSKAARESSDRVLAVRRWNARHIRVPNARAVVVFTVGGAQLGVLFGTGRQS
jgi:hypothetical protein